MKIGFTYDLRDDYQGLGLSTEQISEFDTLETITSLKDTIATLGHQVVMIGHVKNLAQRLVKGERWDLVFNVAEGLNGLAREAQVPTLLDIYQIPYTFSSPDVMINTLNKSIAKLIVREAGVATPEFLVVRSIADVAKVSLHFPVFAKPLAEGTGKGISANSYIKNKQELKLVCQKLLQEFQQPVLVETFLSGREFTVGFLGNDDECQAIGALEVIIKNAQEGACHSYTNKENCEELVEYKLAIDAVAQKAIVLAKNAWQALGCKDAGRIDVRCDDKGKPYFLEANPLAGLHPTHSDLPILATQAGISYQRLIGGIIEAASNTKVLL
jgi:D-alanine-D-alanine ligase